MQKADQTYRVIAVVVILFGVGFLMAGVKTWFHHYTYSNPVLPQLSFDVYPYRNYTFPLGVIGALILMVGIVIGVWAWGRRP